MIRDRPLTREERSELADLFQTLPPADQQAMMRRIRTVSQAQEWFDALSDSDRQVWLTIARSENFLDAWKAFRRKCK